MAISETTVISKSRYLWLLGTLPICIVKHFKNAEHYGNMVFSLFVCRNSGCSQFVIVWRHHPQSLTTEAITELSAGWLLNWISQRKTSGSGKSWKLLSHENSFSCYIPFIAFHKQPTSEAQTCYLFLHYTLQLTGKVAKLHTACCLESGHRVTVNLLWHLQQKQSFLYTICIWQNVVNNCPLLDTTVQPRCQILCHQPCICLKGWIFEECQSVDLLS